MRTRDIITKLRSKFTLLFMTCAVLLAIPAIALADQITNNADASVDATAEVMALTAGGANGTTQLSVIPLGSDGKNGCNLTGQTSASFSVNSSNTAVATVSPTSVTFTACGDVKTLTVTPLAQGSTTISLAQTANNTGGTFDVAPATFTVNVTAPPPANTPPQVSVNGVTEGAFYEKGSVPAATCQVTDTQDGPSSPAATIDSSQLNQYGIGQQTATCSYTDNGGLTATTSKTYSIVDTTKPVIAAHADVTAEATSANGAVVTYTAPTANDAVYGSVDVECLPASGSQFDLGDTTVTCMATDGSGNSAVPTTFNVKVQDTTKPVIAAHGDVTAEATGPDGADVSYTSPATSDAVDGNGTATCTPASGSKFALGDATVTCNATDAAGNDAQPTTFKVTVQDTTKPALNLPANITEEATGPNGNVVNFNATASDLVNGSVSVNCTPASGDTFAIATTTVNCSATDAAGNEATGSFTVKVQDTIAPSNIQFVGNINDGGSFFFGDVPATPTCTATDGGSGLNAAGCVVSGYSTAVGTHTLKATATDKAGNTATKEISYTVKPYTLNGFYQPIDMNDTVNTVKNGSTVPVKFELFKGGAELTSTSAVTSILARPMSCGALSGDPEDPIETLATGGTSLRYDATAGQFVYNWTTPKGAKEVGKCYSLTMTAADSSTITAYFKLK